MSRTSKDGKRVGFGTHITAGGIAGAMEAVRHLCTIEVLLSNPHHTTAMLPTIGHNQSAHAALQIRAHTGGMCPFTIVRDSKSFNTTYFPCV